MPSQKLALEPGAPKRLELTWRGRFKDFRILLDGKRLAEASSAAELRNGISAGLPDGTTVEVKLTNNALQQQLVVLREGKPVPGSATHPLTQVRKAAHVLYLIAGLSALFGLVVAFASDTEGGVASGITMWIAAVIYAVLGFFALRPSFVALLIGAVLYAADGILVVIDQVSAGRPNIIWIVIRIALLVTLIGGVRAARQLKAEAQAAPALNA